MTSGSSPVSRPEPLGPNPDVYPDIAAAGSLAAAMAAMAADLGLDLGDVLVNDGDPLRLAGVASTADGREPVWVSMGEQLRVFWFGAEWQGVDLLNGDSDELIDVVRAAAAWRQGARLREIQSVSPYVEVTELLQAHEQGPGEAVAVAWRQLLAGLRDDVRAHPFVSATLQAAEAAFADPILRGLFPGTGHWQLHFSTCTGWPYSSDVPFVRPLFDGRYEVRDSRRGENLIGQADTAEAAIALVMAHLPAGCGPAVDGGFRAR